MTLDKYILEVDYYYHEGSDKTDDITEEKLVSFDIDEVLKEDVSVGYIHFSASAHTLEDGNFAGLQIEGEGEESLLAVGETLELNFTDGLPDDRSGYARAIFRLGEKQFFRGAKYD